MASWITSRLKAAEQLLQQIDNQAAITKEQLEKPNADLTSLLTAEVTRGGRRAHNDQPVPSQSGDRSGRHSKRSHPPVGSRNNEAAPGPARGRDFGKRDWTELLSSTDLNPAQSASRSLFPNSVGGSTEVVGTQHVSPQHGKSQRDFHTEEYSPASKLREGGAGHSRTEGSSEYMVQGSASDSHRKVDAHQEDEVVPGKREYGAQVLEMTAGHDQNEQHHSDALTYNVSDISSDLLVQSANQDEEFTESELSVPEETKYLKKTNLGVSARDSVVEYAPNLMPGQTIIPADEIEGRDTPTLANSDALSLADEREAQKTRMEAGDSTHYDGGDQEAALDIRGNAEESEVPRYAALVDHGTDRHSDDEGSGGDSGGSSISGSDEQSNSGSGSGSGSESDSEYEDRVRRLRQRRKDRSERRATKAAALEAARAAIRDREELVAKLVEEMENLEKLLGEWEERQVQEAAELNLTMKEVSVAVEVERQRHSITRREGLAREAQLETKNHELAKALAVAERTLEDESARVALARSKVEARDIVQSDLQRMILHHQYRLRPIQPQELRDSKIEHETAEKHFADLIASLEQFETKAKKLEENIFLTRDAHYTPSVMELELESRLNQLTDHLIQKQSQVEALSTEKATLHFRLETISNTLRMEKSVAQSRALKRGSKVGNPAIDWSSHHDSLESGLSKPYSSKDKSFLIGTDPDTILNQTAVSKLARQVDSVFLMGARVLRTSSSARAVAAFYIFLLHSWVLFIFFMHVRSAGSGSASEVASVKGGVNELTVLPHL